MLLAFTIFSIPSISVAAIFMRLRKIRLAYIWLAFFMVTVAVLFILIFSNPISLQPFIIRNVFQSGSEEVNIIYRLTDDNRITGIGIFFILMAYLATETASPKGNQSLIQWIKTFSFCVATWIILLSGNAWTFLISWTILDIVEFSVYSIDKEIKQRQFLPFYFSKILGSMALIYVISGGYQSNAQSLLGGPIANIGIWVLAAVFLHAGIFFYSYSQTNKGQTEKYFYIHRIFTLISNFYLLSQIPIIRLSPILQVILQIFFLFLAVFAAIKWYSDSSERKKFDYLLISITFLASYQFITELQLNVINLVLSLLLICWIYFFADRSHDFRFIWIGYLFLLSGTPFSLFYNIVNTTINIFRYAEIILIGITIALLNAGLIQSLKTDSGNSNGMEKINQLFYILGLVIPLGGFIFIIIENFPGFALDRLLLGGVQVSFLILIILLRNKRKKETELIFRKDERIMPKGFSDIKEKIISLLFVVVKVINGSLHFVATLFEEEGGILWAFVFLSLLLTILSSLGGIS